MKEKKTEVATRGFEHASQLPAAKKARPLTSGPCVQCLDSELSTVKGTPKKVMEIFPLLCSKMG